jgi:hypothetical protein
MLEAIADAWATAMEAHWRLMYRFHRDVGVIDIANNQGGALTEGLFAAGVRNQIAYTVREIRLDGATIHTVPQHPNCIPGFCGMGLGDAIPNYYKAPPGQRDRLIEWDITPAPAHVSVPESLIAIKLVRYAIVQDKTERLHGPIDALELWPDGTVRWILRKPECPEQYGKKK